MRKTGKKIAIGDVISARTLPTLTGQLAPVPDPDRLVHLQLRRFAGCAICNLHLRSMVQRDDEISAAGIREVVVFHSTIEELRKYEAYLPFAVVGDPKQQLYREFGVTSSARSIFNSHMILTIPLATAKSVWATIRGRSPMAPVNPTGGQFGRPADFLIAPDGRVVAVKYGEYAYDQWSVDELLSHASRTRATA